METDAGGASREHEDAMDEAEVVASWFWGGLFLGCYNVELLVCLIKLFQNFLMNFQIKSGLK